MIDRAIPSLPSFPFFLSRPSSLFRGVLVCGSSAVLRVDIFGLLTLVLML